MLKLNDSGSHVHTNQGAGLPGNSMRTALSVLFGLIATIIVIVWIVASVTFSINCGDYLKRAGDSNTIALAEKNLAQAIRYAEANDLTDGNTSVLWVSPKNDLGFWYQNLSESLEELRMVSPHASQLEKSNVLLKLRETLLDDSGDGGPSVTMPEGISIYPHNRAMFWGFWVSALLSLTFGIWASVRNYGY